QIVASRNPSVTAGRREPRTANMTRIVPNDTSQIRSAKTTSAPSNASIAVSFFLRNRPRRGANVCSALRPCVSPRHRKRVNPRYNHPMMHELWNNLAQRASLTLSDDQHRRLDAYLDSLLDANERMNLTRITDRQAAEVQHVGDALTLLPFLPREAHRLADVGSGGGVPGSPLAIARPDVQVVLIESTRKKAAFLRQCAIDLELANVLVRDERAEEAGQSDLRETFDVVTARAVGEMVWLAEWCLPLVRKGGVMLAMKGQKIHEELP